jgi:hypothetical protein
MLKNADRISDFSSGGAARQSAQKRSAPPVFASLGAQGFRSARESSSEKARVRRPFSEPDSQRRRRRD